MIIGLVSFIKVEDTAWVLTGQITVFSGMIKAEGK